MKVKHLLEYEDNEIEDILDDVFIQEVSENSQQFINQFLKKGIPIYRGMDSLYHRNAYEVKTQASREIHGTVFDNDKIRESFEYFLKREGIGSRYHHSISTIAFSPEDFDGVSVGDWFYFIPKGPYKFHYYKSIDSGDLNITESDNPYFHLAKIGMLIELYESRFYYEHEKIHRVLKDNQAVPMIENTDNKSIVNLMKMFEKIVAKLSDIFSMTEKDFLLMKKAVEEADDILGRKPLNEGGEYLTGILSDIGSNISILINTRNVKDVIKKIKSDIVSNEITEEIKESEVVFTCKSYYLIPHNDDGREFLKRITKGHSDET